MQLDYRYDRQSLISELIQLDFKLYIDGFNSFVFVDNNFSSGETLVITLTGEQKVKFRSYPNDTVFEIFKLTVFDYGMEESFEHRCFSYLEFDIKETRELLSDYDNYQNLPLYTAKIRNLEDEEKAYLKLCRDEECGLPSGYLSDGVWSCGNDLGR